MKKLILITLVMFAVNGIARDIPHKADYPPIYDTVSAILLVSDTSSTEHAFTRLVWGESVSDTIVHIRQQNHPYPFNVYGYIVTKRPENEILDYGYKREIIYLDADKKRITNLIVWDYRTY